MAPIKAGSGNRWKRAWSKWCGREATLGRLNTVLSLLQAPSSRATRPLAAFVPPLDPVRERENEGVLGLWRGTGENPDEDCDEAQGSVLSPRPLTFFIHLFGWREIDM